MAGREGFEPPEVWPSTVFKTAAFNHSAISRLILNKRKEYVESGGDTQIRTGESRLCRPLPYHLAMSPPLTLTLYQIKFINIPRTNEKFSRWCPRPDLNRYRRNVRGILSPLCLPISPPGLIPKRNPNALQIRKTHCKNEIALWILVFKSNGAGDGDRTRGPNLGKVVLYHWATPAYDF